MRGISTPPIVLLMSSIALAWGPEPLSLIATRWAINGERKAKRSKTVQILNMRRVLHANSGSGISVEKQFEPVVEFIEPAEIFRITTLDCALWLEIIENLMSKCPPERTDR